MLRQIVFSNYGSSQVDTCQLKLYFRLTKSQKYIYIYNISFQYQPRLAQNLRAAIPSSSKLITYLILTLVIQKKVKHKHLKVIEIKRKLSTKYNTMQ